MAENDDPPIRITPDEVWSVAPPPPGTKPGPSQIREAKPRTSQLAIASLVLGLISIPLGGCLLGPIAILVGTLALSAIAERADLKGTRMAFAGLSTGIVGMIVWFGAIYYFASDRFLNHKVETEPVPTPNAKEAAYDLESAPDTIRPALLANVVVRGNSSGGSWMGSGVVVGKDATRAFIITNKHVARPDEGTKLETTFSNGKSSHARIVWDAPDGVDAAIVEVSLDDTAGIEPIALDGAADTKIGQAVFAVGNPMSYVATYTTGVISSVRKMQARERELKIFQIQVPINHGNSGGGLYTSEGRLIGINTWTADKSEVEGISFAISARSIVELLRETEPALHKMVALVPQAPEEKAP